MVVRRPRASFQTRDERLQGCGQHAVPLRNDDGFMGTKPLLLGCPGSDEADADDGRGLGPAVPGALLDLAQFSAEPALVAGPVEYQLSLIHI